MNSKQTKTPYKRIALVFSLCALIIWGLLGTGASLAWFVDTSETLTNIFHIADFELEVSHRTEEGKWKPIDGKTDIFDDEAIYEPGYVQVIYLKVENKGDHAFDFHTAISVKGSTTAINVFGQQFWLHEHLKFGVAIADTEEMMDEAVSTREKANAIATMKLQNYSTDVAALPSGGTSYLAVAVRMPEEVGNEANYRGTDIPKVELGIIVKAEQQK